MTAAGVSGILSWTVVPLLGALLGFIAARIAAGVALRPANLRKLAGADDLQSGLRRTLSGLIAGTLDRPLAWFFPAGQEIPRQGVKNFIRGLLRGLVSSPSFLQSVRTTISDEVASFLSRSVTDIWDRTGITRFISEEVLARLAAEDRRQGTARAVASAVTGQERAAPSMNRAPGFMETALQPLLEPLMPTAIDHLVEGLKSDETREVLSARGRELLPKILEKLNLLQRFLISAGQFDRRLDEQMPEIVDETIIAIEQVVRDPRQQQIFLEKLVEGAQDWSRQPQSRSSVAPAIEKIINEALSRLSDPSARGEAVRVMKNLVGSEAQTLRSALLQRAGLRDVELADSIANAVLSWFSKPQTEETLSSRIADAASRFLEENAQTPLRAVLRVDAARQEKLETTLVQRIATLSEQAPAVQPTGTVGSGRARRWIGLFGAALGLLISLLTVAVSLLLGLLSHS